MRHPTHVAMFARHYNVDIDGVYEDENFVRSDMFDSDREDRKEDGGENIEGLCFIATTSKSPMIEKVRDLLIYLSIPLNSYDSVLSNIDGACSYMNDLLISMSSDVESTKVELYNAINRFKEKNSRIEGLNFKLNNVPLDHDSVRLDNILLTKQRIIYCNTTKRIYGKLTLLYHTYEICKEQHHRNFFFLSRLRRNYLKKFHLIMRVGFLSLIRYLIILMYMVLSILMNI